MLISIEILFKGLVIKRDMGNEIRSVSFDSEGTLLAVGFKDGQISLLGFSAENKQFTDLHKTRERCAAITCVRYSIKREINYTLKLFGIYL
jgi:WD40 repeat protein